MDYQTFNIFEFGKKKFSKTPFFDTEGNIRPFETQLAIVSHYLHLKGTKYEVTYKAMAVKLIEHWSILLND